MDTPANIDIKHPFDNPPPRYTLQAKGVGCICLKPILFFLTLGSTKQFAENRFPLTHSTYHI